MSLSSYGQNKPVEIISSDIGHFKSSPLKYHELVSNVHLRHDSTDLYCDSALFFIETNTFEAFGNVLLQRGDSIELICDSLVFYGNENLAKARSNVYLRKDTVKLFSDNVEYNIDEQHAKYINHGKVINVLDTLESEVGFFDFVEKSIALKTDVYSRNSSVKCNSHFLDYNTETNHLKLKDNVVLKTDSSVVFLDKADYDDFTKKISGKGNIKALYQNYTVYSDSIQMLTTDSILWAWDNVHVIDSNRQTQLKSNYSELYKKTEFGLFQDSVYIEIIEDLDTMYLYSDSLTLNRTERKTVINAVGDVKIWRPDIQAVCDSINFNQNSGIISLNKKPIAWMNEQQIVSDTMRIKLQNNELDSMFFIGHVFMIKTEIQNMDLFSQIKGRQIDVNVESKSLESTFVNGNAEVIYCMFTKDKFDGLNTMNGAKLKMSFKNRDISKVIYLSLIDGKYIPSQHVTKKNRFLLDFKLYSDQKIYKPDFQVF